MTLTLVADDDGDDNNDERLSALARHLKRAVHRTGLPEKPSAWQQKEWPSGPDEQA